MTATKKTYHKIKERLDKFNHDFGKNIWLMHRSELKDNSTQYEARYNHFNLHNLNYYLKDKHEDSNPYILNNDVFLIYRIDGEIMFCLGHMKLPKADIRFFHEDINDYTLEFRGLAERMTVLEWRKMRTMDKLMAKI